MEAIKGSPRLGRYLKSLRRGHGYSLRRVEEKARREGGEIDNSQLSRYEKGVCYPSFDKLRVLASIFNVSIQNFSDVVELEELDELRPDIDDPAELLARGKEEFYAGAYGHAHAHFEWAGDLLDRQEEVGAERRALRAKVRLSLACTLEKLGKLSLSEHELRQLLLEGDDLETETLIQVLLQLSNVHTLLGEFYLAEMGARKALQLATDRGDQASEAMAHHSIGWVFMERRLHQEAQPHFHAAMRLYKALGNRYEFLAVRVNLGAITCARGRFREGVRILTETQAEAKKEGRRRLAALAASWLGEVHFQQGHHARAQRYLRESNTMASTGEVRYVDILFLNAFYLWKISRSEGNTAQAKIAFGRMKYLRSSLERVLPEVREFDRYIQRKGGAR